MKWSACGWVSRIHSTVSPRSRTCATISSAECVSVRALRGSKFHTASIMAALLLAGSLTTYWMLPVSGS